MLPLPLQFLVAMLAHAINERMARRVEYLQEEVRVLKECFAAETGRTRIAFTPDQRRRLATKGKALTPEERRDCCQIVRPETILTWFRQLTARRYDGSDKRSGPGRPRKANDIRDLVIRLASENPGWGYTKIRDALRGLKIEIGRTTIASILAEADIEPAPERSRRRTWRQFLRSHWETLYACDFFGVDTLGAFGTVRFMVFFVMELKSRAVQVAGIRIDPDGAWMAQMARNLLDPVDGFLREATDLIHDRDPLFTQIWTTLLESGGVKCVPIPAQSPNCNPYAERVVRTVRSECLDHFVIFGERHLRHLLAEFVAHYHSERYHQGIGGRLILPLPAPNADNATLGAVRCRSRLGGQLNFYVREAA
ncbi:MAG: integrase core domain-containing protein [Isosphaeraceae bacterium]